MDSEEILLMLKDCKRHMPELSEWEFDFIDSLSYIAKKNPRFELGAKQLAKLENIWERITG